MFIGLELYVKKKSESRDENGIRREGKKGQLDMRNLTRISAKSDCVHRLWENRVNSIGEEFILPATGG